MDDHVETMTCEQRLVEIGKMYHEWRKIQRLHDTPLAALTYLAAWRKSYLMNPLDPEEEQLEMLKRLDELMADTYSIMREHMAATPTSMSLHVVTKR